jgi:hypothetical protein
MQGKTVAVDMLKFVVELNGNSVAIIDPSIKVGLTEICPVENLLMVDNNCCVVADTDISSSVITFIFNVY